MDFDEDPPVTDSKGKKPKKSVVIDDKHDIKFINVENPPTKPRKTLESKVDLYEWPWRAGTVVYLIGYLFHVIAYATPYWMITSEPNGNDVMHIGLWSACSSISNCTMTTGTQSCLNSVRVFGGVGILSGLVTIFLMICIVKSVCRRGTLNRAVVVNCFLSALCIQIASSVFWRTDACFYSDNTSATTLRWAWSLALSFTSLLLQVVAGLVFLVIELITISRMKGRGKAWNGRGFFIT